MSTPAFYSGTGRRKTAIARFTRTLGLVSRASSHLKGIRVLVLNASRGNSRPVAEGQLALL